MDENSTLAASGRGAIQAEGLVKRFGTTTAVNGVSFRVNAGEFFGFLGPNGAGKTTTIHMLCTLLKPTAGFASVNGYDVVKHPIEVRSSIGLVFQEPTLDKDLTIRENLLFTCSLYGMAKAEAEARISGILEVLNLRDRQNDLIKRLSGGLRRRVDIARGVLHRSPILFLDEPTIGLDPQARADLWAFIDTLRSRDNLTVFLTTHYLEEAERCDRVGIIHKGSLVALGSPRELKSSEASSLTDVFLHLTSAR